MSDQGNQIGQVNVKVNASGVEETNRKLDEVAAHAKRTAASVGGIGGFSAGSGMTMGGVIGPGGGGGGGGLGGGATIAAGAAEAAKQTQVLGNSLTSVLSRLFGIGSVVYVLHKLADGMLAFSNASRDASNQLRDISEGFKVNLSAGESSYEKLTRAAKSYHETTKRGLDIESDSWSEIFQSMLENKKMRAEFTKDGVLITGDESNDLANKRKQNDDALQKNLQAGVVAEKNASDLRIKNIGRETQTLQAKTAIDKVNLAERFALEDEKRNRASAFKRSEDIKDEEARKKAQADIYRQGEAEAKAIRENAAAKRKLAQLEHAETIRQFQASAARGAAGRFGPGNSDLNTLLLKNINQSLQVYGQMSRRF